MKDYATFGNCQAGALAETLKKNNEFNRDYKFKKYAPVHTLSVEQINIAEDAFENMDLLIYQVISDSYKIKELSTNSLMTHRKKNSITISFPSMYFNAYFPHLEKYKDVRSILNLVHDYIIMYAYTKGLSKQALLDLIQSDVLYSHDLSISLLNKSIDSLKKREIALKLNVTISDFIERNYQTIRLFNSHNHPKGILFDVVANKIFDKLGYSYIKESHDSKTVLDGGIITPIYKSTYKNLGLSFDENFHQYTTPRGDVFQDEIIDEFYKTYSMLDKEEMKNMVKQKKPYIVDMFNVLNI